MLYHTNFVILYCDKATLQIYRSDSFEEAKLLENLNAFVSVILRSKPATVKGTYVKSISLSSTMGPGIKVDTNSFDN